MPAPFTRDHETFDHEPSVDELTALLGERFFSSSIDVRDDDDVFEIAHPRVPLKPIIAFLVVFILSLAYVPVFQPDLLPAHFGRGPALGVLAGLAFLIAPAIVGIAFALDRKAANTPPGVIAHKATRRLELPRAGVEAPFEEVAFVTELRRWDNQAGNNDKITQWGVVIRADESWSHYPVGHFLGKPLGKSPAQGLSDVVGVRVRRTTLDTKQSKLADAQ